MEVDGLAVTHMEKSDNLQVQDDDTGLQDCFQVDDHNFQIQIVGVDLKMEDSCNVVAARVNES